MAQHFLLTVTSQEFLSSLRFTFICAMASSLVCIVVAVIAAPGYGGLGKIKKWARPVFLFPQLISPVLIVLSLLLTYSKFPFGFWGVVLGHLYINAGLAVIILGEKWDLIDNEWKELSSFLGASPGFYFRRVVLPLWLPQLKTVFSIVFVFSISSLLIPLVLGGGPAASTLETLAFEKIKAASDMPSALSIGFVQLVLQWLTFFVFIRTLGFKRVKKKNIYFKSTFSLWSAITLGLGFFLTWPYIKIMQTALQVNPENLAQIQFGEPLLNSLVVGLAVAALTMLAIVTWNAAGGRTFIRYIPTPGHVVVGLVGFLLLGVSFSQNTVAIILSLILFHLIVFVFPVTRFVLDPLRELNVKYGPALETVGGSLGFRIKKIFWPLGKTHYLTAGLIAFCWSLGEFTVSALVAPTKSTLPVFIQSLLDQYRLEEASAISLLFLFVGLIASVLGEVLINGEA